MARQKQQSVTIDGVDYKSPTAAAVALVAAGKTISEAAAATGITYQTVYANTKGAEKAAARRVGYQVLALGKRGKRSPSEIAKKTGMSVPKIVAMLKNAGIVVVTKEAKAAAKAAKAGKAPKAKKAPKAPKAPEVAVETPVVPVVEPVVPVESFDAEDLTDEIPMDPAAEAAAAKDAMAA
jgi:DNA-binding CsgD family transcriptional regulator